MFNKKGIKLWKITNSLEELKTHCNSYHKKKFQLIQYVNVILMMIIYIFKEKKMNIF